MTFPMNVIWFSPYNNTDRIWNSYEWYSICMSATVHIASDSIVGKLGLPASILWSGCKRNATIGIWSPLEYDRGDCYLILLALQFMCPEVELKKWMDIDSYIYIYIYIFTPQKTLERWIEYRCTRANLMVSCCWPWHLIHYRWCKL